MGFNVATKVFSNVAVVASDIAKTIPFAGTAIAALEGDFCWLFFRCKWVGSGSVLLNFYSTWLVYVPIARNIPNSNAYSFPHLLCKYYIF